MILASLLLLTAVGQAPVQIDTLVQMPRNGRLEVLNARGTVNIGEWDRAGVRVQAHHRGADTIAVTTRGGFVTVVASSHRGTDRFLPSNDTSRVVIRATRPTTVRTATLIDYTITVPAGVSVHISGNAIEVTANGISGPLDIGTMNGAIRVATTTGPLQLQSLVGSITVEGGSGRVLARAHRGSVSISGFNGSVDAFVQNGPLDLSGVIGAQVRASSLGGTITMTGPLSANGRYSLNTQRGDVFVTLPSAANATVDVASRQPPVVCEGIPLGEAPSRSWRRYIFGEGNALVEVDSFGGAVRLCRAAPSDR